MDRDGTKAGQGIGEGAAAAWPICLGYIPIGLAFGVIARKAGLSPVEIGLMSLFVFAGSSQFVAVSMLAGGAGFVPVIATTFLVNLRHLLMSSAIGVYLRRAGTARLFLFSYGLTDESFAVNMTHFRSGPWGLRQALTVNHLSNAAWVASTIAGGYGGSFIPAGALGVDYALTGMFLCLLAIQLRGALYVIVAIVAGASAVLLSVVLPGNSYIILSSLIAATVGLLLKMGKEHPAGEEKQ